jgi:hypothetical protein
VALTAEFIEVIYFTVNGFKLSVLLGEGTIMPKYAVMK